jgi:imidazolonepropionase-like amidohydrolase
MLIKNGYLFTTCTNDFEKLDIRIENTKITEVDFNISPKENEEVIDAAGKYITPGFIDAHSHICISEEGMGEVGDDCCDYSDAITPQLEVLDGLYPFDRAVERSVRAGVTCACVCPGSDGVIGGVASVIRLTGKIADEMIVTRKAAVKGSLGENPKAAKHGFASRMGTAYHLRKCLEDTKEYLFEKEEAEKNGDHFRCDPGKENMAMVLRKEIPLHIHAHRSDDICTAIRIAKEYDIRIVIVHCTDGIDIAEHIAASGFPAIVGPSMNPCSKQEVWNKSFETAGILNRAGVKVCITADHDVTPLYYLPIYAAMAVRFGMDDAEALRAVTSYPAEILGIDDRKGALVSGKDADLVIWSHHPFDIHAKAEHVFIEGKQECKKNKGT